MAVLLSLRSMQQDIREFLLGQHLFVFGVPHAEFNTWLFNVYGVYVPEEELVVFVSPPMDTIHGRIIGDGLLCGMTTSYHDEKNYRKRVGVQAGGMLKHVTDEPEAQRLLELWHQKMPFVFDYDDIRTGHTVSDVYCYRIDFLRYWDNQRTSAAGIEEWERTQ